jgi:hypothetical protein
MQGDEQRDEGSRDERRCAPEARVEHDSQRRIDQRAVNKMAQATPATMQ